MKLEQLEEGMSVLVRFNEDDAHEFVARIDHFEGHLVHVVDQDDNGFRVLPEEIEEILDDDDDEHDQFRDDVEADADALAGAGYGTDEDYGYFGDSGFDE